jgi:hypothetical protein
LLLPQLYSHSQPLLATRLYFLIFHWGFDTIHPRDELWEQYSNELPAHPSARQLILLDLDFALTSCGFGVPFYDHVGPRDNMDKWLARRDEHDIHEYWREKNQVSLDGLPTGIFEDAQN